MRRRKKSCILSYNNCSHKKCHVKISTTFFSSLIPCIRRRWGTQRQCGVDVIGLSRRLLQCFLQGRVRSLSLSVGHCTVHLAAIKQAIPFSFPFLLLMSIFFFSSFCSSQPYFVSFFRLAFHDSFFLPRKSFDSLFPYSTAMTSSFNAFISHSLLRSREKLL